MVEVEVYLDDEFETDVEINPNEMTHDEKEELISALKQGKKYILKGITVHIVGTTYSEYEPEPMYNEGYY